MPLSLSMYICSTGMFLKHGLETFKMGQVLVMLFWFSYLFINKEAFVLSLIFLEKFPSKWLFLLERNLNQRIWTFMIFFLNFSMIYWFNIISDHVSFPQDHKNINLGKKNWLCSIIFDFCLLTYFLFMFCCKIFNF